MNADSPSISAASNVNPDDIAIAHEVAYRMQSDWTGEDMFRACLTAAMLGRSQGRGEVVTWLDAQSGEGHIDQAKVFEAVIKFGVPHG